MTDTDDATSTDPLTDRSSTDETTDEDGPTVDEQPTEPDEGARTGAETGRDIVGYVEWAAFGILCLLALVATFRFYFAASEAIRLWFSPDFVPVFQAVFNLVVLVASALGVSILVRRIA